jgi:hypothetical protein
MKFRTPITLTRVFACATDIGLFISENDGLDWRLLREGAYSTLY